MIMRGTLRKIILEMSLILIIILLPLFAVEVSAKMSPEEVSLGRGPNDVHIAGNGIGMPIGRILLVRRGNETGAIRFIKDWFIISKRFSRAEYESYIFTNPKEYMSANTLIRKKSIASWNFIANFLFWGNAEVKCGSIRMFWTGNRTVYFYSGDQYDGDYGIEFAPTPWMDISQVNLSDQRIKWFRYNGKRDRVNIPIDNLWVR